MNVLILKTLLTTFALLVFSGCTKTIYEPFEVLVAAPVACTVPEPYCNHNKPTDTEVLTEARLCIKRLREALSACKFTEK